MGMWTMGYLAPYGGHYCMSGRLPLIDITNIISHWGIEYGIGWHGPAQVCIRPNMYSYQSDDIGVVRGRGREPSKGLQLRAVYVDASAEGS